VENKNSILIKGIKINDDKTNLMIATAIVAVIYGIVGSVMAISKDSEKLATSFTLMGAGISIAVMLLFIFFCKSKLMMENGNFTLNAQDIRIKKYKIHSFWGLEKAISISTDEEDFLIFPMVSKYQKRKLANNLKILEDELKSQNVLEGKYQISWLKTMCYWIVSFLMMYLPMIAFEIIK
jgi:hypothetical protein